MFLLLSKPAARYRDDAAKQKRQANQQKGIKMIITLYKDNEEISTIECDEIDITTGNETDKGALFQVSEVHDGIIVNSEIAMWAEFGENQITLLQAVS
jgi:hypothetical protein